MPIEISDKKVYTTREAVERIGRHRDTVMRWIRLNLIDDVEKRDFKGDRVWTDEDIERFRKFAQEMTHKILTMKKRRVP